MFRLLVFTFFHLATISQAQVVSSPGGLVFQPNNYTVFVSEDTRTNGLVLDNLSVTNANPTQRIINLACSAKYDSPDACSFFQLVSRINTPERWNGSIQLAKPLNWLQKSVYSLSLEATDGVNTTYQNVSINVQNAQTRPPNFVGATNANTPELSSVSPNPIHQYLAEDPDRPQRFVRYRLSQNPGNYFRIEEVTGRLFNLLPLQFSDASWSLGYRTIQVQASEILSNGSPDYNNPASTRTVDSTITLTEASDTPPVFGQTFYIGTVPERSQLGTVIQGINIVVTDSNKSPVNSAFELILDRYADVFRVEPNNATRSVQANILVLNPQALNYDLGFLNFQFSVIARETQGAARLSSSANVTVNLIPMNNYPPVFTEQVYSVAIHETIAPGSLVIQTLATDMDVGEYGNASIRYKIISGSGSLFKCDKYTGRVTVAPCDTPGSGSCIDYERVKSYQLTIVAVDDNGEGFSNSTTVNITIIDDNDNPPVFPSSPYTLYGNIVEGTSTPVPPLQVTATDRDSSYNDNNKITYRIISGDANGLWSIDSSSGRITATNSVLYSDTKDLGYFLLVVEARDPDPTHTAVANVNITVTPVNRFTPAFTQANYTASITETDPPGTSVEKITATDGDSPATPNGVIRYRLQSGGQDKFIINAVTGQVTIAPGATFDATLQSSYSMQVVASDQGNPPRVATSNLIITVLPNRPEPKFTPSTIRPPPVRKSEPIGTNVTLLVATNTNPNRSIVYNFVLNSITGLDPRNQPVTLNATERNMFTVDPNTGLVTVNQPLNYDRVATWQATVLAVDTNLQTRNTGTATIIITVLPVNDKPPSFNLPWTPQTPSINTTLGNYKNPNPYLFSVPATSPNASLVITYNLIDDYNGAFNISNVTGQIGLTRPLDYSRDKNVKFVVTATDNGFPPLTSTSTVYIQLTNINEQPPVFNMSDYISSIPDNVQNGTVVVTVSATDPDYDDYGQVRYEFSDVPPDNRFNINSVTGVITVAPGATFDGAKESLIILHVRAYDSPNDPISRKYADATVQINVVNINRDPPRFTQQNYAISIPESSNNPNNTIIQVLALRNGLPTTVEYSITSRNDKGLFAIDPSTGGIRVVSSLTGQSGMYNLSVMAMDYGSPRLNGTATVIITVLPSSYPLPIWNFPESDGQTVYINELDPLGTFVARLNASNQNSRNGPITYYLSYNNGFGSAATPDFQINTTTGVITTARNFGYEGGKIFVLNVAAVDDFNTPAKRTVVVVVRDVHKENPWFKLDTTGNCTEDIYWQISINSPNGSVVNTLSAQLQDPYDDINYSIIKSDPPSNLFTLQPTPNFRSAKVIFNGAGIIKDKKLFNFTVRALDKKFDPMELPPKRLCGGMANQTDVNVHVRFVETKPVFDFDLHTCIKDDTEIGTDVYQFESINYDGSQTISFVFASLECLSRSGANQCFKTEADSSKVFSVKKDGWVETQTGMGEYKEKYFNLKARATYDDIAFAEPVVTMYVVPYTREILVTFSRSPDLVKADMPNIVRNISEVTNGGKVCVVGYKYHVTDEGVVDPSRTDVLMYVIDGRTKEVVPPLTLDKLFKLNARKLTYIIGITEAYAYWAGFIYHPVAIAIGIIIGLLVIALLLFCCCCIIWTKILALCRQQGEKEPLIFKATSLGAVNPAWTPKPLVTEEQILTMPVPDGDGGDRTIALGGVYNRPPIDEGDGDIIGSGGSGIQGGAGAQSLSGYVHIEAPLTASRSPSAFGGTTSGASQSQVQQETTTFYESTTAGGARYGAEGARYGAESPYTDTSNAATSAGGVGGAGDNRASYSTTGANKYSRGTMADSPPPMRSHSTGTMTNMGVGASVSGPEGPVRLNNPGDVVHSKIGATLFRPGGQAYAQSVISGTTMVDHYEAEEEVNTLYGTQHDARLALPLDTEVMYSHVRPTSSYYDDADVMPHHDPGFYQGEVRVMPMRGSVTSEQFQETRFM